MKLSIWIFAAFLQVAIAKHTCYSPDGKEVSELTYVPCIAVDGVDSMCCKMNHTNPDTCDPNGLCFSTKSAYWREFCTDPTWESPNCLPKTTCDDDAGGRSNWTAKMTRCPGGTGQSFCCGTDCCGDGNEINLDPTLVSIGSSNTTATVTSTPQKADNRSPSKVAIGVGVGVPLGILAIAMLGLGFFWGKKKMRAEAQALREQSESQMRAIQRAEPRELPSKPYADAGSGFITPAELEGEEENKAT